PKVACVLAVPPLGYMHARYICRRLRSQFPNLKIIGAILTEQAVDEIKQRQPPIAADELACSVREVQNQILNLFSVRMTANPSQSALTAA
ncbi:MAG TPA: hypothetical protein VEC99_08625, partial [Clostridia bacterium]|nr:hypothetical protein [Clostridia bacterium]